MRRHEAQAADRGTSIGGPKRIDRPDELGEVRAAGKVELAAGPPSWSTRSHRSEPARRRARADRPVRAPRRGGGTGRPPGSGDAGPHGAVLAPNNPSTRPASPDWRS